MQAKHASLDYAPLLCHWLGTSVTEAPPHTYIANIPAIACRLLRNGGRFENARVGFLPGEPERNFTGLTLNMAQTILAGGRPAFWHWQGDTLVVDGYYLQAESSFISMGAADGAAAPAARKRAGNAGAKHHATH